MSGNKNAFSDDEEFRGVCRQRRDGASPIRQDLRNLITWFKLTLDAWSLMMTMIYHSHGYNHDYVSDISDDDEVPGWLTGSDIRDAANPIRQDLSNWVTVDGAPPGPALPGGKK